MAQQPVWTDFFREPITRRAALQGGAVGVGSLVLFGCGADADDEPSSERSPTTGAGATEATDAMTTATLTAAIASDVGSLDPMSLGGTGGGNWPSYTTIFGGAGLVTVDPATKEFFPGIADSWEESPDHLTWTFTLNPSVTFHDGRPVTAEDVKFSMDRNIGQAAYNPAFEAGYSGQFEPIVADAEVLDPLTVRFNLKVPDVIFLRRPLFIVPKAYIEEVGDEGFAAAPVGAGWFKFGSHVPDSELTIERWDDYHIDFGSDVGIHPAYVQTLVQKVIPEDQARLAALQAGEVDLVHNVSSDIARQLEGDEGLVVHYLEGSQPMIISINTAMATDPTTGEANPWRDKRVRVAANMAVDLDAIIGSILTGRETPAYGSNTRGFGFPEELQEQRFAYDPEAAKKLLAEAGYPDGFETTMVGPTGRWPNSRSVMEAVAQFLAEVGIRASVQELQYQEVTTRIKDRSLGPLIFFGMSGEDDPGNNFRYNYHSTSNFQNGGPVDITAAGDDTAKVDALIEQSEAEFDPEKRRALLEEIITTYYLSAKNIWLYQPVTVVVTTSGWAWDIWATDLATPEYWNIRPV